MSTKMGNVPATDTIGVPMIHPVEGKPANEETKTMRDCILQIVLAVLADINIGRSSDNHIIISPDTWLLGRNSGLDSLELVRILLDVEERVSKELQASVALMDERAMSQERSPFRSVNTLTDYIVELLEDANV
jgi:acyl carrier protein